MTDIAFEELAAEHLPHVLEIYTYYVLHTTATFHIRPLTLDEMKEQVLFSDPKYKTFAIVSGGAVCGYVSLKQYKKREAYDTTAEVTVYLRQEYTGKGIGSVALQFIEGFARARGIHVLVATITGGNTSSLKLFEKNGYVKCAEYKEVGRKMGQWLDLVACQKILE